MGGHCGYNHVPVRPSSSLRLGESQQCFTQMKTSPMNLAPGGAQPTSGQSWKAPLKRHQDQGQQELFPWLGCHLEQPRTPAQPVPFLTQIHDL